MAVGLANVVVVKVPGAQGPRGAAGAGVPTGGETGQVLGKLSNDDYDTGWVDNGSGGGAVWGAITGDITNQADLQAQFATKASLSGATFTGSVTALAFSGPLSGNVVGNLTGNVTGNVSGNCTTVTTINGRLAAGTGISISGSGTAASPYTINSTGGSGTVTTTGSPSSGNIAKFSGATSITNAVANTDYQVPLVLTTVGSSGAATFDGTTLNIPQYTGAVTLAFSAVTAGTNTAALVVGTGGSLSVSGSGSIAATTAAALATARNINGVAFDGTASITVTAAAGTLTGTTLNSSVVTSSLTAVGTIATGVWNGTVIGSAYGGAGTVSGILKANGSGTVSAAVSNTDYQAPITLTTTGTSGAATFNGTTLNIPDYSSGAVAFSGITSGTNTTATMTVGTGGSLTTSGSGTITATAVPASGITGTTLASNVVSSSLTSLGTLSSLAVSGTATFTSTSSTAVVFNGASPVLTIDGSTASQVTGVIIKGAVSSGIVTITAAGSTNAGASLVSAGNANVSINAGGSGAAQMQTGGTARITTNGTTITFQPGTSPTAATRRLVYTAAADTSLTAGTEAIAAYMDISATRQHASNTTISLQRDMRVSGSTHSFASATGTITLAAAFSIDGAPIAGTNAAITAGAALYIPGSAVGSGTTSSYGIYVEPNTGATNNYAAYFNGNVGIGVSAPTAFCHLGASTTKKASICIPSGTAPTSPVSGDMWYDGSNLKFRDSGTTRTITWT